MSVLTFVTVVRPMTILIKHAVISLLVNTLNRPMDVCTLRLVRANIYPPPAKNVMIEFDIYRIASLSTLKSLAGLLPLLRTNTMFTPSARQYVVSDIIAATTLNVTQSTSRWRPRQTDSSPVTLVFSHPPSPLVHRCVVLLSPPSFYSQQASLPTLLGRHRRPIQRFGQLRGHPHFPKSGSRRRAGIISL